MTLNDLHSGSKTLFRIDLGYSLLTNDGKNYLNDAKTHLSVSKKILTYYCKSYALN